MTLSNPVIGFHDKKLRWLKATGRRYDEEPGKPANFAGTVRDITREKLEAEEEQLKNLTLMEQAEAMAEMGSWEYDLTSKTLSWSAGMFALFGLDGKKVVTPEIFIQSAVDEEKVIAEIIVLKLRAFETFEQIFRINKKEEIRSVKIKSVKLHNNYGEFIMVLGVAMDVTENLLSEEKLKHLNYSLNRRNKELEQKNEDLSTYAFVASHDLREPLRKITTFSNFLIEREQECLTEKGRSYLQRMQQSVERMQLLIDDVLALAQLQTHVMLADQVDLNEILKKVEDELDQQIKETGVVITADNLPTIKGHETMIFSLFNNLISNSIKYRKKNITPHIAITAATIDSSTTNISHADPGSRYTKLSFKDNGIGFDAKHASQIFQIFRRLHNKNEYAGTGIGLALCKKIMDNHNGFITADSEPEIGSVFCCYFPVEE